ncbi:hypothetical protein STCU_07712 [Strigomonas culicis]|uniref:SET domain-containing protein n=1 Tax=Strigomonas culicis TaxID=28005 RepID=S9TY38_9TRYP|nr:hypothetical protein STCU_07712 [Strigomonas culicis]|eukprot:EPY23437.1 hypothetical protein STCU_07712 [Strigomonas culicis]
MPVYDALAKIITSMCFSVGIPLSLAQMSKILDDLVEADLLQYTVEYMVHEEILMKFGEDSYTLRNIYRQCQMNLLITEEYQHLGMSLLQTDQGDDVRYIPAAAEHRFVEVRPSLIGHVAGHGLFVRSTRRIPQGCIFCEYRGRHIRTPAAGTQQGAYVVRVRTTEDYIDGVSHSGDHLSLATFINDCGPLTANAGMMEYDRYPGRVFMVAHRDIGPGEEIYSLYGATYWGFSSYAEVQPVQPPAGRSAPDEEPLLQDSRITCKRCGHAYLRRAARLHREQCADPRVDQLLHRLDCLPYSDFTAMFSSDKVVPSKQRKALKKATSLVDIAEPQTFFSHA